MHWKVWETMATGTMVQLTDAAGGTYTWYWSVCSGPGYATSDQAACQCSYNAADEKSST